MDLSALHASQTLCHICLPFKIHNLLLPRKEDYLLVGPLFTENLSESDFQLLLAEYGVKPTEDLLIYFHSLTSMEEESFQRLLHYLSEELGKPFTEITLSRPPKALSRPESFSLIQESDQISHNYACQYMDCVRNFSLQNQEALAASMQTWEGTLALAPAPSRPPSIPRQNQASPMESPPHAICPNPICPPVSIKNAARPSPTTCSPAAWNRPKSCSGIVLCRLEK